MCSSHCQQSLLVFIKNGRWWFCHMGKKIPWEEPNILLKFAFYSYPRKKILEMEMYCWWCRAKRIFLKKDHYPWPPMVGRGPDQHSWALLPCSYWPVQGQLLYVTKLFRISKYAHTIEIKGGTKILWKHGAHKRYIKKCLRVWEKNACQGYLQIQKCCTIIPTFLIDRQEDCMWTLGDCIVDIFEECRHIISWQS